jgi:hypothetical protein
MVRGWRAVAVAVAVAGAVGCSPGGARGDPPPTSGPAVLAVMTSVGGRCTYGPCLDSFSVADDGAWRHAENGVVVAEGRLPADDVVLLARAVERSAVVSGALPAFTGTCPTAVDGSEVTYEFTVRNVVHRAATCERRISADDPGVRALTGLRDRWAGDR